MDKWCSKSKLFSICSVARSLLAWIYTFRVTPTSECPITYCKILMSILAFAILVQNVWRNTWGVMCGNGLSEYSFLYFFIAQRISFSMCNATFGLSPLSSKRKPLYPVYRFRDFIRWSYFYYISVYISILFITKIIILFLCKSPCWCNVIFILKIIRITWIVLFHSSCI